MFRGAACHRSHARPRARSLSVKFAAAGVIDVVEATSKTPVAELQRADVHKLGNLILSLACRNPAAPQQRTSTRVGALPVHAGPNQLVSSWPVSHSRHAWPHVTAANESMEFIASSYSAELRNLLFLLVS